MAARRSAAILLLAVGLQGPAAPAGRGAAEPGPDPFARLVEGVHRVRLAGVPDRILVTGPQARAILAGPAPECAVVAAAARVGRGRLLACGQDPFAPALIDTGDGRRFLANAERFLGEGYLRLGTAASQAKVARALAALSAGRGVFVVAVGWGWRQLHRGRDPERDWPVQRVLRAAGLRAGCRTVRQPEEGFAPPAKPALLSVPGALAALEATAAGRTRLRPADLETALLALRFTLGALPPGDPVRRAAAPRLPALWRALPDRLAGRRGSRKARLLAAALADLDPRLRSAAPGRDLDLPAADFPGPLAGEESAPVETHAVELPAGEPGWLFTGLYAPPARVLGFEVEGAVPQGLRIQIGCHTDRLWHKKRWRRFPEITVRAPLVQGLRLGSRYGGPIYVLPAARSGLAAPLGLRVTGAVWAARYSVAEGRWDPPPAKSRAPFGEVAGERIVFTLPRKALLALADPRLVLGFFDRAVRLDEELDPQPPRRRKQRVVFDRQISAGYMHSGYPIMAHLDAPAKLVDPASYARGTPSFWGLLHEIGHNYQQRAWTFAGTREVTNNLFVLYCQERLLGVPLAENVRRRKLDRAARRHLEAGAPFATWQQKPFVALACYAQLIEAFGWDFLRRTFLSYREHPLPRRASDTARRTAWVVRCSKAAGRDLRPFFRRWGVPFDEGAAGVLAGLPPWSGGDSGAGAGGGRPAMRPHTRRRRG